MSEIPALLKAEIVDEPAGTNPLDERRVLGGVRFGKVDAGAVQKHGLNGDKVICASSRCSLSVLLSQYSPVRQLAHRELLAGGPRIHPGLKAAKAF